MSGIAAIGMKYKNVRWYAIGGVLILCACIGYRSISAPRMNSTPYASAAADAIIDPNALYEVTDVIDGDTFKVRIDQKIIVIRVLGINTPETVDPRKPVECYGKEASDEMKSLLAGESVKLALNPNREKTDKYGRLLAFAYLGDMFVNEYMIQEGYAREYTVGSPYEYQAEFRADQTQAQQDKKGLWGKCP